MIKLNQNFNSKIALVTAVFFISAFILNTALQEKVYASPPPKEFVSFIFTVKHVFETNSKIQVIGKNNNYNEIATVPGQSGTQHVTISIDFHNPTAVKKGDHYTLCLSAPGQGKKCFHEHITSDKVGKHLTEHKTINMKVLGPH